MKMYIAKLVQFIVVFITQEDAVDKYIYKHKRICNLLVNLVLVAFHILWANFVIVGVTIVIYLEIFMEIKPPIYFEIISSPLLLVIITLMIIGGVVTFLEFSSYPFNEVVHSIKVRSEYIREIESCNE